jgi:CHAT domain-containing protein
VAILFGTNAVDAYQQIRRNMTGLDKDLQAGFAQSKSSTYRELAELLVSEGRLAEAEHVLDLLKDAELKETVRGAANNSGEKTAPLPQSETERAAEAALAAQTANADSATNEGFELDRLSALPNPTAQQKDQIKILAGEIAVNNAAVQQFFDRTLYNELGAGWQANARASSADTETSSLSNLLAGLGPGTLALYTLIGEQHSYIIVTTPTTRTRYELHTNAADLGKLVLALREELRTPASDPLKDLAALSGILLDPIAADLAAAAKQSPDGVPTLLWSLDGVLRYVPMNALFDPALPQGSHYLLERARNVVVTPESRNHLLEAPTGAELKAAAFGVSQSYLGLYALSGVPGELNAVVHDPAVSASHGPLAGKLLRDDAFTLTALESTLRQHYPVVHIASHFVFQAGNSGESYLLLSGDDIGGKGYELTMSQLQTDPLLSFRGTRLLTLSACSTAEADTSGNGREIDSLGMVMQKRDAAAVLATLWDVNDASTSVLMSDFYRRWAAAPNIQKIEALRQAQIAMLLGSDNPTTSAANRGTQVESQQAGPVATNYAHPYYWAPFVLIGNFR